MNIKKLRKNLSMTQEQLASLMNVKQNTVSRWEKSQNEPSYKTLLKLCVVLQCSIEDLVDDENFPI